MSRERAQAILCESFGPWGKLDFPYVRMGNIDSLHLFGDTELMIFAMYYANRHRWRNVLDIGANLGLHSILLGKLNFSVRSYEPDFEHFQRLLENLDRNSVRSRVKPFMAAVHTSDGSAKFVRVLNNLTGSHIDGYKNSYGPTETVIVPTVDCRKLWPGTDFAKIDSEGNECELIKTLTVADVQHLQMVVEVRNESNARGIFMHCNKLGVPMWSQKLNWEKVESFEGIPKANRDGILFIGHQGPWGSNGHLR
jgi:FkbM family methyltransferase